MQYKVCIKYNNFIIKVFLVQRTLRGPGQTGVYVGRQILPQKIWRVSRHIATLSCQSLKKNSLLIYSVVV